MTLSAGRRIGLAAFAALVSLSALFGTVGLATGVLALPAEQMARLPFGSGLLGGVALALVVALPTAVVAWLAWRGDARTDRAAVAAGILLAGWIVVQLLVIRAFSFFHPTYLAVAASFLWAGRRAIPSVAPTPR